MPSSSQESGEDTEFTVRLPAVSPRPVPTPPDQLPTEQFPTVRLPVVPLPTPDPDLTAVTSNVDRKPGILQRAGWNLIDQIISSGSNAALSVVIAKSVDELTFGGFAVAFTVFAVVVGLSRAIATQPLSIRFSGAEPEIYRRSSAAAVGTALVLGVVLGIGSLLVGFALGGVAGQAMLALGVVLPGLLVQDAWRQVFFAEGRPAAAALNDTVWAVIQFAATGALLVLGISAVGPLLLAWGGAATAAAVLGIRQARLLPHPGGTLGWLRDHYSLTRNVTLHFATEQGSYQGALLAIAAVGSLTALGALRGAQVLLGVTAIFTVAVKSFAVPEFSRRRDTLSRSQWVRYATILSLVVTGAGAAWGVLFLILPDAVGIALLGDTWPGVSEILVPSILGMAVNAMGTGPSVMMFAMDRTAVTLTLHVVMAPLIILGGVGGALIDGAAGAAWGFLVAYVLTIPFWYVALYREAGKLAAAR